MFSVQRLFYFMHGDFLFSALRLFYFLRWDFFIICAETFFYFLRWAFFIFCAEPFGKNLIYHLLNKNYRKFVKVLLNKIRVNQTIKLLPSQTPTSIPLRFTWHIIVSVPEIKIWLWDKEKLHSWKVKVWVNKKLSKMFTDMDGINYRVLALWQL